MLFEYLTKENKSVYAVQYTPTLESLLDIVKLVHESASELTLSINCIKIKHPSDKSILVFQYEWIVVTEKGNIGVYTDTDFENYFKENKEIK